MLGSLEAKVLGVLERKEEANVREVVNALNEDDEDLAYTTVGTILNRLHEKGLVDRAEEPYKGGSRYVYEYVDFQDEYIDEVLRDVVALFGDEGLEELRSKVEETETVSESIADSDTDADTGKDTSDGDTTADVDAGAEMNSEAESRETEEGKALKEGCAEG